MYLDFNTKGKVKIDMTHYVDDMIKVYPDNIRKSATTPAAAEHLFTTRSVEKLDEQHASIFHTITAK